MSDQLAPVRKYYSITDERRSVTDGKPAWILRCKGCNALYELKKPTEGQVRGGNILALLNHAYSHNPQIRREAAQDDCE